jgi:hypothetical protein
MTADLSEQIDYWVRCFRADPALADSMAKVLGDLMELEEEGAFSQPMPPAFNEARSVLMMALGRCRESQPD